MLAHHTAGVRFCAVMRSRVSTLPLDPDQYSLPQEQRTSIASSPAFRSEVVCCHEVPRLYLSLRIQLNRGARVAARGPAAREGLLYADHFPVAVPPASQEANDLTTAQVCMKVHGQVHLHGKDHVRGHRASGQHNRPANTNQEATKQMMCCLLRLGIVVPHPGQTPPIMLQQQNLSKRIQHNIIWRQVRQMKQCFIVSGYLVESFVG